MVALHKLAVRRVLAKDPELRYTKKVLPSELFRTLLLPSELFRTLVLPSELFRKVLLGLLVALEGVALVNYSELKCYQVNYSEH